MKNIKRDFALVIVDTMHVAIAIIPASAAVVPDDQIEPAAYLCGCGGSKENSYRYYVSRDKLGQCKLWPQYDHVKMYKYVTVICDGCGYVYESERLYATFEYCGKTGRDPDHGHY